MEQLRRETLDREQMAALEQWWLARMIATPRPLEEKLTLLWHGHFATNHRTVRDKRHDVPPERAVPRRRVRRQLRGPAQWHRA